MDIREVPSEMPMYLLAEDEGNEEEILRLLESESPGGSPCTVQNNPIPTSNHSSLQCNDDEHTSHTRPSVHSLSLIHDVLPSSIERSTISSESMQSMKGCVIH